MESATSRTPEPPRTGFTMLEVLVAMVIIGVVLLAALRGAISLSNSARDARYKLLAVLTAENRLQELRLLGPLTVGVNHQDCEQGGLHFICEQSVEPTPNPFFRRVQVRVLSSETGVDREYALLMTILPAN
jgi:general secretion pathway protein I